MGVRSLALVVAWTLLAHGTLPAAEETVKIGRFGTVSLYYNTPQASHVVLFVSGDGGWNLGVVDMARALAELDALVVGVDVTVYLPALASSSEACAYPASDFEFLSKVVQKKLEYPGYITPVLVGYSSGATLVYATLVQAPSNTFLGAISMGFCPELSLSKPLCRGSGLVSRPNPKRKGVNLLPAPALEVPWIVLQGDIDQVCSPAAADSFVKQVPKGRLVTLPKVGHGFSVQKNWMPQFKESFSQLVEKRGEQASPPPPEALGKLPVVERPVTGTHSNKMAIIVSGDGGWGVTETGLSDALVREGVPVVGLNSLQYFWTRRTPETTAADFEKIARHYLNAWSKEKLVVIGYSLGADVVPFAVNRLPQDLKDRITVIVLLGPTTMVDFQFHLTDWLGDRVRDTSLPVLPEVQKLSGAKVWCFYGSGEKDSLCPILPSGVAQVVERPGGHRIGHDFDVVVKEILPDVVK